MVQTARPPRHAARGVTLLCLLAALLTAGRTLTGQPPEPDKDRIARLIEQLGAAKHADREAASRALENMVEPAVVRALQTASTSPDPEIRERAKAILGPMGPLLRMVSPVRADRVQAAGETYAKIEESADPLTPDKASRALRMLTFAIRACPDVLRDNSDGGDQGDDGTRPDQSDEHTVRRRCLAIADKAPAAEKAAFLATDVGLCVCDKQAELDKTFPDSSLAGRGLYEKGEFAEYVRRFGKGFYVPQARYCLISGRKSYAATQEDDVVPLAKSLRPREEVAAWPAFLADYPDFEGADDANYRYARALEATGDLVGACLRLRLAFPDGDMSGQTLDRLVFLLDARATGDRLAKIERAFAADRTRDDKLLLPAGQFGPLIRYMEARQQLRAGQYAAAAKTFRAAATQADAAAEAAAEADRDKPAPPPLPPVDADDGDADDTDEGEGELMAEVRAQATREAAFCDSLAAFKLDTPDGDLLYELASLIYKHKSPPPPGVFPGPASSYVRQTDVDRDFCQADCRYWQAERLYARVVTEFPKCDSAVKAAFMRANCWCHMADSCRSLFWRAQCEQNVRKAIAQYRAFAARFPDHDLAGTARRASETMQKRWFNAEGKFIDRLADDQ